MVNAAGLSHDPLTTLVASRDTHLFLHTIRTTVLVASVFGFGDGDGALHTIVVVLTTELRITARFRAWVAVTLGADFGGLTHAASQATAGVIHGTRVAIVARGPLVLISAFFFFTETLEYLNLF